MPKAKTTATIYECLHIFFIHSPISLVVNVPGHLVYDVTDSKPRKHCDIVFDHTFIHSHLFPWIVECMRIEITCLGEKKPRAHGFGITFTITRISGSRIGRSVVVKEEEVGRPKCSQLSAGRVAKWRYLFIGMYEKLSDFINSWGKYVYPSLYVNILTCTWVRPKRWSLRRDFGATF